MGVYLDDLLVTQRVKRGDLVEGARRPTLEIDEHCGAIAEEYPDSKVLDEICNAYRLAGLPRALHKSFRNELKFRAWGAEIDGDFGIVAAP